MIPDPYAGTDLLADVFPGTGGTSPGSPAAPWFWPHPGDTRWKPRPRPGRSER